MPLDNPDWISEPRIPSEIARDSELAAAIASHQADANAHLNLFGYNRRDYVSLPDSTYKLLVESGEGYELSRDDAPIGNIVIESKIQSILFTYPVPIDVNASYEFSGYYRWTGGNNPGNLYFVISELDANGNELSGDGYHYFYALATDTFTIAQWVRVQGAIGFGQTKAHHPNAKFLRIGIINNWAVSGANGIFHFCGFNLRRLEPSLWLTKTDADLLYLSKQGSYINTLSGNGLSAFQNLMIVPSGTLSFWTSYIISVFVDCAGNYPYNGAGSALINAINVNGTDCAVYFNGWVWHNGQPGVPNLQSFGAGQVTEGFYLSFPFDLPAYSIKIKAIPFDYLGLP